MGNYCNHCERVTRGVIFCRVCKKDKYVIHIIPSGSKKSLCGINATNISGSSLGLGCNCKVCLEIAKKIMMRAQKNTENTKNQ